MVRKSFLRESFVHTKESEISLVKNHYAETISLLITSRNDSNLNSFGGLSERGVNG
jgi:hypothetical protein